MGIAPPSCASRSSNSREVVAEVPELTLTHIAVEALYDGDEVGSPRRNHLADLPRAVIVQVTDLCANARCKLSFVGVPWRRYTRDGMREHINQYGRIFRLEESDGGR